jgi:hypothetical protein
MRGILCPEMNKVYGKPYLLVVMDVGVQTRCLLRYSEATPALQQRRRTGSTLRSSIISTGYHSGQDVPYQDALYSTSPTRLTVKGDSGESREMSSPEGNRCHFRLSQAGREFWSYLPNMGIPQRM